MSSAFTHDPAGRPVSLAHDLAGTGGDQVIGLGYNPASQIVSRTGSNDAFAWTGSVAVNRPYAVNGLNQYSSAGASTFGYDPNGNLIAATQPPYTSNYVYDVENRLVSASGAQTAFLVYDPLGRLFQVSGWASGATQFLYDDDALVAEYNSAGTMVHRYIHGALKGVDDPLIWYDNLASGWRRPLIADQQGSIVAIADMHGNPVAINAYDEYGIPKFGNVGRFQYTGQAWIPELGMYYYKARVYSPTLGRFLQTDPIGYQGGTNVYAYVGNDPINLVDSTGQAPNRAGATDYETVARDIGSRGLRGVGGDGDNINRYFYTNRYGWVDTRHFATAANDVRNGTWGWAEESLGFAVEVTQWATEWGDSYRSGFSPEDLPSNSAGVSFGQYLSNHPKGKPEQLFRKWAQSRGAQPRSSAAYRKEFGKLPANDPSERGGAGRGSSNASSGRPGNSSTGSRSSSSSTGGGSTSSANSCNTARTRLC